MFDVPLRQESYGDARLRTSGARGPHPRRTDPPDRRRSARSRFGGSRSTGCRRGRCVSVAGVAPDEPLPLAVDGPREGALSRRPRVALDRFDAGSSNASSAVSTQPGGRTTSASVKRRMSPRASRAAALRAAPALRPWTAHLPRPGHLGEAPGGAVVGDEDLADARAVSAERRDDAMDPGIVLDGDDDRDPRRRRGAGTVPPDARRPRHGFQGPETARRPAGARFCPRPGPSPATALGERRYRRASRPPRARPSAPAGSARRVMRGPRRRGRRCPDARRAWYRESRSKGSRPDSRITRSNSSAASSRTRSSLRRRG